ncbi:DNA-dependent RNA polymerase subunit epsilon [Metabacillus fastidiosus]|uniref:DNA-directed RNA polymerase subunit epsilon n=1 Tax=Metabacillus fastidiosus TaxID=1458 RepID=A0ABU6NXY6_9BACI|nr:DNA-directed RNA polymerase subunit epsilon [Metabacillus fastidiosus]MEC2074767.1 DNA-directed RNA polymerase subunit epsilon [Metabacillus fastidiosus]MED4401740.1 DNA-directed RNA polymerase subunit epsilon [Metabacillus fastidiosus]MED4452700.1 DNA-directed RNA polymerase subunit epsilon [Metabacillus fastidiosus]MED4463379.1 DNA-directed RNA polymerase subunit epsilon [Metabacillus fastidiosus]
MIYKVYFQEKLTEVPVRERTNTLYIKGNTEGEVRLKLKDRHYNIEYIQPLDGAYLDYEQQNENYKVLEI